MSFADILNNGWTSFARTLRLTDTSPVLNLGKSLFVGLCATITLSACTHPTAVETIQREGVLNVVTIDSERTLVEQDGQTVGFEYELAKQFADRLGVKLRMYSVDTIDEVYESINKGYASFAAAGIALNIQPNQLISPTYASSSTIAIYRQGSVKPKTPKDLIGKKVAVIKGSPAEHWLTVTTQALPELTWEAVSSPDIISLFAELDTQNFDILIASDHDYEAYQAYFPELRIAFEGLDNHEIGWLFTKSEDLTLYKKAVDFLSDPTTTEQIAYLQEKYYGHQLRLDFVGAKTFKFHTNKRLPKYRKTIEAAAEKFEQDYYLLAAIGYQESHWNPKAKSPTGVRGFMMLTRPTAKDMGVSNRLNAEQSIQGGAKYFSRIHKSLPERIQEPDRTWFALAAYNVGRGHLEDARILTEQAGKNPDQWADVKEFLPLLQDKRWYKKTKYGYARGYEPVIYVQNIRRYIDVLRWYDQRQEEIRIAKAAEEPTTEEEKPASVHAPVIML
ncbi:membrane-bound lytic murein transglycosylase MltF [Litoribrevibacter albus]|uniref:Membrane-bound lytic murein transglycosylase F n=1 Tax=Litoribrevibacter albus TaxID=1473156 RepID=A0AA37SCF9_9GAMM|nr:membrane-bound lytic murein transglycosylase MltF [Litoribrevibacter albus]GLQ32061.1 membrane-bound lytic murein transglycosylase F [Litoribrevibacter albus]